MSTLPSRFFEYKNLVVNTAGKYGYDSSLLAAQVHQESAWNPGAVSSCGAKGLMQFMDGTWKEYGSGDPFNPAASLDAGVRYMRFLFAKYQDIKLALAAYNTGPGNLNKAISRAGSKTWSEVEKYLPNETRNYVPRILSLQGIYKTIGELKGAIPIGAILLLVSGFIMLRRCV